jgi:hypothetical protein
MGSSRQTDFERKSGHFANPFIARSHSLRGKGRVSKFRAKLDAAPT